MLIVTWLGVATALVVTPPTRSLRASAQGPGDSPPVELQTQQRLTRALVAEEESARTKTHWPRPSAAQRAHARLRSRGRKLRHHPDSLGEDRSPPIRLNLPRVRNSTKQLERHGSHFLSGSGRHGCLIGSGSGRDWTTRVSGKRAMADKIRQDLPQDIHTLVDGSDEFRKFDYLFKPNNSVLIVGRTRRGRPQFGSGQI